MSTVLEIESAIRGLPEHEFWELADRFEALKDEIFAAQMQADSAAGKLDFLFEEAETARRNGSGLQWPADG